MNFLKNLKIAYWATFKPNVFDAFARMCIARTDYLKKSRAHKNCEAEKRIYNIATVRFLAEKKG